MLIPKPAGFAKSLTFIFVLSLVTLSSLFCAAKSAKEEKKGTVLYVDNKANYLFINLGKDVVKEKDIIEIYRGSSPIASGAVKAVMEKMAEVIIENKTEDIKIGDSIQVTADRKDPPKISVPAPPKSGKSQEEIDVLNEKIAALESEKNQLESKLVYEISALKENEKSLKEEVAFLKEPKEPKEEVPLAKIEQQEEPAVFKKSKTEKKDKGFSMGRLLFAISIILVLLFIPISAILRQKAKTKIHEPKPYLPAEKEGEEVADGFEPRKSLEKFLKPGSNKKPKDLFT